MRFHHVAKGKIEGDLRKEEMVFFLNIDPKRNNSIFLVQVVFFIFLVYVYI